MLDRLWNDIKKGENIDLYATIIIAFCLVILGLVGIASSTWIASLTLAVLGLLTISTLVSRHRMETILDKLSQSSDTVFMEEFPTFMKSDIERATDLWLVAVTLTKTTRDYYSTIEQVLHKGGTVKILLVHPEGAALEMAATRAYVRGSIERVRNDILGTLEDFSRLRSLNSDKLELRTVQNSLGHGIIAVNPDTASGILYIANYPFRTPGGSQPKFMLRARDGRWYDLYKKELHLLWEYGAEWQADLSALKQT